MRLAIWGGRRRYIHPQHREGAPENLRSKRKTPLLELLTDAGRLSKPQLLHLSFPWRTSTTTTAMPAALRGRTRLLRTFCGTLSSNKFCGTLFQERSAERSFKNALRNALMN